MSIYKSATRHTQFVPFFSIDIQAISGGKITVAKGVERTTNYNQTLINYLSILTVESIKRKWPSLPDTMGFSLQLKRAWLRPNIAWVLWLSSVAQLERETFLVKLDRVLPPHFVYVTALKYRALKFEPGSITKNGVRLEIHKAGVWLRADDNDDG